MQAWREGGCCFRIGCLSSATLQVTARTETLLAAFARRRGDRDGRGGALAQARRRRAAHVWVVLAAAVEQGRAVVLLFFCRRSWSLSRAFSLVVASCGTGPRQCGVWEVRAPSALGARGPYFAPHPTPDEVQVAASARETAPPEPVPPQIEGADPPAPLPPLSHHPHRHELYRTRRTASLQRQARQTGHRPVTVLQSPTSANAWGPLSATGSYASTCENSQPSQEQLASNGARQGPISFPSPPLPFRTETLGRGTPKNGRLIYFGAGGG